MQAFLRKTLIFPAGQAKLSLDIAKIRSKGMEGQGYRYDAFISYRHLPLDKARLWILTPWIFKRPGSLIPMRVSMIAGFF